MLRFSFLLIFLYLTVQLTGCKKSLGPEQWEFSFTYNGHTYTNPDYGNPILLGVGELIGIEIRKPDILGGIVRYIWTTNCAYVNPEGMNLFFNDNTCTFFNPGIPIDSSKVFSYSSGSKNYTITNCKTKNDWLNGGTYTTCTFSGSFTLVLINNAGLTKSITGTFKLPDARQ